MAHPFSTRSPDAKRRNTFPPGSRYSMLKRIEGPFSWGVGLWQRLPSALSCRSSRSTFPSRPRHSEDSEERSTGWVSWQEFRDSVMPRGSASLRRYPGEAAGRLFRRGSDTCRAAPGAPTRSPSAAAPLPGPLPSPAAIRRLSSYQPRLGLAVAHPHKRHRLTVCRLLPCVFVSNPTFFGVSSTRVKIPAAQPAPNHGCPPTELLLA